MSERWRCFVAVPLDASLRESLAAAIAQWRADARTGGLRWVEPEALHLTLAFLGAVEPGRIGGIEDALRAVGARHAATSVPTGRLDAFARPGSARVLWYYVDDPHGAIRALAADLAATLELDVTEPYRPHVTLARARRRSVDLRGWIEGASQSSPLARLDVARIDLERSHLGSGPARYETLASVPLGVPTHV